MLKVVKGLVSFIVLLASIFTVNSVSFVVAASIDSIPNTDRTVNPYGMDYLAVTGYASLGVNDRSEYIGTTYYRAVGTEREFLQAIADAKAGTVKVIEITNDLDLGWTHVNLSSEEMKTFDFIKKYKDPTNGFTNPNLARSGVSEISIGDVDGLTIFSQTGVAVRHAEIKLKESSNDIIIRNLHFDGMWQWDDTGKHKEAGWAFIQVNGANNVWIDHNTFSIAADGLIDLKNGASNVTISWSEFGLQANENPEESSDIYQSIQFMEEKYLANQLGEESVYRNMRDDGATKEEIMAYAAYHSKAHLNGSGDKDYVNYFYSDGREVKDGNQRIRLSIAYSHYNNIGQRVPMVRQGVGHMYGCYLDNSTHENVLANVDAIAEHGTDTLSRALNARNGASVAADGCVFNEISEPITGAEVQGLDTKNMNAPWDTLFQDAYNRNLIVNSKIIKNGEEYIGSSWDQQGENPFTEGFTWYDKSTIGNWAWSSHIIGSENMDKSNPPEDPFEFQYNTAEKLPYEYQVLPLEDLVPTLEKYAGAGKVILSQKDWLRTDDQTKVESANELLALTEGYKHHILNHEVYRKLTTHLVAVVLFEKQGQAEKVLKQLDGFKTLLTHYKDNGEIGVQIYDRLIDETEFLLDE